MESQDTIFEKLKQSKVFKVLSGYAIAAFVTVQVASLVSDSFGLEEEFMQNIIIVFLVILPFIALVAWAASSKYGTFKILGISLFLLFTGYGTGSYIWVNSYMLPQVKDYLSEDDNVSAWLTSSKINSFAPFFSSISNDSDDISALAEIKTQQDGVSISWRAYASNDEWRLIGRSPIQPLRLPRGILQFKLEKEGYETSYFSSSNPSLKLYNSPVEFGWSLEPINIQPQGSIPPGMTYIQGGNFIPALTGAGVDPVYLHPFYIDKFEVTNKDFKGFMDAGGYSNSQYWVEMDFIKDGVSLSFEQAQEIMIDSTGMTGPAGWEVGTYLQGTENKPVTGISWYEALAYARYKGNILPPMYHWAKAAFPPDEIISPISPKLLKTSNFSREKIEDIGQGEGAYGTFDMAGNAKEWVWNIFGGRGLTLGGAFDEPTYLASQTSPQPRMDRSLKNGFRTARLINPRDLNPFGDPIETQAPKDLSFYKPMSDEVFKVYSRSFEVDSSKPKSKVIYVDDSHPIWIKERISIEVGYNQEMMDMLIFKPKNSFGPSSPVVIHPGSNYYSTPPEIDDINPGEFSLDFLIKSGKTLVWPAWKGSLNRMPATRSGGDRMRDFRNLYIAWVGDTNKTLDYLETRNDIDTDNIFYLGMSYGALFNTHTLLFENRYKGAILYVGGVFPTYPPLVDGINHMPRINTPFLMLNGEQDYLVPKSAAMYFYQSTGTPEKDKKIVFYDSGHWPLPRNQMIKETLDFIKKYSD
ncbi:SUMF1/EgtB/PvdO family nonheme iron enzyme [Gammaproteobacteria bacterium]|nr:SUMF1/EgtB/PvdO family nonheme iron enzyme [Gammaproteobacteria bacterium]MDC0590789.1 SUMF1/EgtB/PvdO family nonheme iron enzyme [Gammaproteobacteria bacterium]